MLLVDPKSFTKALQLCVPLAERAHASEDPGEGHGAPL